MMKASGCDADSTAPPDPETDARVEEDATSTAPTFDHGPRGVAPRAEAEPGTPSETRYVGVSYLSKRAINFTIRRSRSGPC